MLSGASNETPNLNCFKTKEIYTWQCRKWRLRQPAGGSRSHGVYQEPGCACLRHPPPFCVGIVPRGGCNSSGTKPGYNIYRKEREADSSCCSIKRNAPQEPQQILAPVPYWFPNSTLARVMGLHSASPCHPRTADEINGTQCPLGGMDI